MDFLKFANYFFRCLIPTKGNSKKCSLAWSLRVVNV